MTVTKEPNLLFVYMILSIILLSIVSCELSLTYVYGKSDKSSDNGGGGSSDGGGDGSHDSGKHKGSDKGKGKGGDGGGSKDSGGSSDGGGSKDSGGSSDGGGSKDSGGSSDGGGSKDSGGSSDGGGSKDSGGSSDGGGSNTKNKGTNKNNGDTLLSQAEKQTLEKKYGNKVSYVAIGDLNNKTNFDPNKVTLTVGSKVVWLNKDNSDHTITLEAKSKSKYPLLNSLILPNGMVDYEFQSAGMYSYSDVDNPQVKGIITIVEDTGK
jgi:plastocyanin